MSGAELIAVSSLAISVLSILWNVFFGYAKLIGRMDLMQRDVDDIKSAIVRMVNKMDESQKDMHKIDIRVNTLEQRKP